LLTPGRSVALDRRLFPPAALAYVQTKKPVVDSAGQIDSWADCSRFVLNQDTGGAIRGPGRADLFWGNGASGPHRQTVFYDFKTGQTKITYKAIKSCR
jgi:membrane-bound lytic murein transglycosylase